MKFFFKLLLKAGFTLGVMFFGYKYVLTGNFGGIQIPGMDKLTAGAEKGLKGVGNATLDKDVVVYQWVDDKGVTHFGGTPPTGQGSYEKKSIKSNTNIMNAVSAPEKEEKKRTLGSRISRVGSLYTPGGAKNAIDEAKEATEGMSDQMADQEKALNEIMGKMDNSR